MLTSVFEEEGFHGVVKYYLHRTSPKNSGTVCSTALHYTFLKMSVMLLKKLMIKLIYFDVGGKLTILLLNLLYSGEKPCVGKMVLVIYDEERWF